MKRRSFLAFSLAAVPFSGKAQPNAHVSTIDPLVRSFTGGRNVMPGKVTLVLPRIADNGHSVPVLVKVDSPQTAAEHVRSVHLISEKNPVRDMVSIYCSPQLARAEFASRLRLNGSQKVVAMAQMSDGSFWSDMVQIEVREAACTEE
jgi:sulfur-oxidizing protein SoxY